MIPSGSFYVLRLDQMVLPAFQYDETGKKESQIKFEFATISKVTCFGGVAASGYFYF